MRIQKAIAAVTLVCAASAMGPSAATAPKNNRDFVMSSNFTARSLEREIRSLPMPQFSIFRPGMLLSPLGAEPSDGVDAASRDRDSGQKLTSDSFLQPFTFLLLGLVLLIGGAILRKRPRQSQN